MDWKFWVPVVISVIALIISRLARRDAKRSSGETMNLRKRLEAYEYFPIVQLAIKPKGDKVFVELSNLSSKNAISQYTVRFNILITIGAGGYCVQRDNIKQHGQQLMPGNTDIIDPADINNIISDSIPALKRHKGQNINFVVRATAECAPSLPQSEKVYASEAEHFAYDNDHLVVRRGQDGIVVPETGGALK